MKSSKRNRSKSSRSTSKANRRRSRKNRLRQLEALEDRQLLTAFTEPTTPNDTWQTANTVAVPTGDIVASRGQTNPWLNISGEITTRGDVDFFKFTLPARSGVFFDIDSREPNTQGGSTSLDTEIAVLAANGTTEIRKNDDGADFDTGFPLPLQRPGDGAGVDSAMYVDLNPGDYFVKVRSVGGTGNYVLRMLADTNYSTQFPSLTRTVPGATDWVYLDLDGHASTNDRWTREKREDNGQVLGPYNAPAFDIATVAAQQNLNEVTPAERLYVHNYFGSFVENMSPFNVNVSTSIPANASFNDGEGYRIVLTSATAALHGDKTPDRVRGVAYDTSYTRGQADNNVGFVFAPTIDAPQRYNNEPDRSSSRIVGASVAAGETAAHEFGHALGLNHFPIGNPANGLLQSGRGSFGRFVFSSAATAPVKDTNGRITTPAFNQDDLAIISSTAAGGAAPADIPNNTFGYRADDHGNTTAAAQTLVAAGAGYTANGIIERVDDRDFFRFVANGNTTITADVNDLVGNLDTELRLYGANGQELAQHAPANSADSTITRNLAAGTYFVDVRGATQAGTKQGIVGQYRLNITTAVPTNAKPTVTLPSANLAFAEGSPAVFLDAAATIADPDSANFNNGTLTLSLTAGADANDRVGILSLGRGPGQVAFAGNDVAVEGVKVGTFANGADARTPLTITLNANATVARTQTLLRNLVYLNVSENPTGTKTAQVVLSDGAGGTSTPVNKTIQLTPVNDGPVLAANTQLTLNANAFGIITNTLLRTTDVDNGPAQLTYTVTTVPTNGTLQVGTRNLAVGGDFTQADIDAGSLRYTNTGATNADAFRFTVADGAGGTVADTTFAITVNPAANTAPVLATNAGLQIDPDGTLTITNAMLNTTDADNPPAASLIYRITQDVQQGTLRLDGNFLLTDSTFSQDDINNNRVTYDSWDNANDTFQFTATDGTATLPTATFNITKIARNAAPELAVDAAPTFAKVSEDAVSNQGMFVYELLSSVDGVDLIKDDGFANPPSEGIAMFGTEQDNGVWEYSLDAGRTWQAMGELSDSSARLLAADFDTMLRFIPNSNFHGSVNASFRAWDRTDGVNGQLADATETGGDTCFSTASATATMTIDSVNDAPSFVIPFDDFVNVDAGPRVVEGFAEDIFDPEGDEVRFVVESFEVNADVRFEFELFETPTLTFTTPPSISPEGTLSYEVAPGSYGVSAFEAVLLDDGVDSKGAANFSSFGNRSLFFISALDLDIDDSQQVDVADGEMILRRLAGFQGEALTEGLTNEFSQRTLDEIDAVIAAMETEIMDIDLNGQSDALSDGILLMRYLEGNAGNALVDDVVDPGGSFTDAIEIGDFLCDYGLFETTEIEAECRVESQEATEEPLTEQTLQVEATEVAMDGDTIEFDVQLTAEQAGLGLGLRMHYNSNAVSLNELGDVLPEGLIQQQVLDDIQDFDNDPATDKFVLTLWADLDGMWPVENEVTLFSPSFELADDAGNATFGFTDASLPLGANLTSSVTEVTVESLQGDLNGDDAVNFDDFLILSENYGKDVPASTNGDLDGDGHVDFGDYLIFRHEFLTAGANEPSRGVVVSQRRIAPAESSTDQLGSPQSRNTSNSLPLLLLLDQGGGCPCGGVGCLSCRGW